MFLDTFLFYFVPVFLTFVLIFLMQRTCVQNGELRFSLNRICQPLGWAQSFIVGIPMMILPACQYYVGTDYGTYVNIFENIEMFDKDLLWKWINITFSDIGFGAQNIFIFSAIVIVFFYIYAICSESKMALLSLFMFCAANYYVMYAFCQLRQGIAMGILLVGFRYIKQRHLGKYLACVLLATGFHYSALLGLLFYWLYGWHIRNSVLLGVMCLMVILRPLIGLSLRYLAGLTIYGDIYLGTLFDENLKLGLQIAVPVAILICALLFRDVGSAEYDFFLNCEFIAFCLIIMTDMIPALDRVYIYFQLWSIFFIPLIIQNIRDLQIKKFFTSAVVLCYSAWFVKLWMQTIAHIEGSPLAEKYSFFV